MAVFPQLLTGALAQYSIEKVMEGRALVNESADGSRYVSADPQGKRKKWTLAYVGLSDSEFKALEDLFAVSEGRLQTFTFCDPTANLLGWTENLNASAWQKDPLVNISSGGSGPVGQAFHLDNAGSGWAELGQNLAAPAGFTYAFSAWVRGSGTVRMRSFAGSTENVSDFALTSSWKRVQMGGSLTSTGVGISFAIALQAAGSVDVAGPQVEAQLVAGDYKKSATRGGVFSEARFSDDELRAQVQALDWVDTKVMVESRVED